MREYEIGDIIDIISEKRCRHFEKYKCMPNTIVLSRSLLTFIKNQFSVSANMPTENIVAMYGMNIELNDHIECPEEIIVYNKRKDRYYAF